MPHTPRKFVKLLAKYELTERPIASGHKGIFNKEGKIIYRFAGTPKNSFHAIENNIKDLIKLGALPTGLVFQGRKYVTKRQDNNSLELS